MILGSNWFYRPRIDVELKQYEALAFIQYLDKCLDQKIIAPPLEEINEQIKILSDFLNKSTDRTYDLSRTVQSLEIESANINYLVQRDEVLVDLETIATFLLKKVNPYADRFTVLKRTLMEKISIDSVGLIPTWRNEGWILLNNLQSTKVYRFHSGFVLDPNGVQRISTEYFSAYDFSQDINPASIKATLIRDHDELPNPMTYIVTTDQPLPLQETYLPLAIEKINSFC